MTTSQLPPGVAVQPHTDGTVLIRMNNINSYFSVAQARAIMNAISQACAAAPGKAHLASHAALGRASRIPTPPTPRVLETAKVVTSEPLSAAAREAIAPQFRPSEPVSETAPSEEKPAETPAEGGAA